MRKTINSTTQQFAPVSTDNLVLDATPTVNSFNSVTSDGVARAIAGASGEVPVVTENDNGKVLKAIYDEGGPAVEWGQAENELPAYDSTEDGKVLGVVDNEGSASLQWVEPPTGSVVLEWESKSWSSAEIDALKAQAQAAIDAGTPLYVYDKARKIFAPYIAIAGSGTSLATYFFAVASMGTNHTGDSTSKIGETGVKYTLGNGNFGRTDRNVRDLPLPTSADNGKVLGITDTYGALGWVAPPTELPAYTSSEDGKVLGVVDNSGTASLQWVDQPNGVPNFYPTEEGKVLGVVNEEDTPVLRWVDQTEVDQTYDSYSSKAQSGTAVAEAVGGVLPSITGNASKVLAVNSGATGLEWVAQGGGGGDTPLPTVAADTLRFEFEDGSFDPSTNSGCNFTGTSWAKVTESVTRNIWDCTLAYAPSPSNHFAINARCRVIDGLLTKSITNLFNGARFTSEVTYQSTGLLSFTAYFAGNAVYYNSADFAFAGCSNLEHIHFRSEVGSIVLTSCKGMFVYCNRLQDVTCTNSSPTGNSMGCEIESSSAEEMFRRCRSLRYISGMTVTRNGSFNAAYMFYRCGSLESIGPMFSNTPSNFVISTAYYMFSGCCSLVDVSGVLKFSATNLQYLFENCYSLERVALLDLNNTVTSMESAFSNCNSLTEVNIVNSGSVTNWQNAFSSYDTDSSATSTNVPMLKLPSLDTSGATDVIWMFRGRKYADGALAMYQQLSQQANPPTTTTGCFTNCGSITHAADLAQIPASWGGTGA